MADNSDGEGGGNGSDETMPDDLDISTEQIQAALQGVLPDSVINSLENRAEEEGGWKQFAMTLANDNKKLRDKNRNLTEAPEGAVIIPPDQADALARIKKHGDLDEAAQKLDEHDELQRKVQRREKEQQAREALKASGIDPEAFLQMDGARDLEYKTVTSTQEEDGEEREVEIGVVRVTEETEDGEETRNVPLTQYVEDNYAPFKDVLISGGNGGSSSDSESSSGEQQESRSSGPRMPRRSGPSNPSGDTSQGDGGGDYGTDYVKNKHKARNSGDE